MLNKHYSKVTSKGQITIPTNIRNNLNIVPVIAVDYSLANLTFDEKGYCLHSLKPG